MQRWRKRTEVGHDGIHYTVYESERYLIADDEVRPPLTPEDEWNYEKWMLYRKHGTGREELLGRHPSPRAAKAAAHEEEE